ncbi:transcriptional regulator [Gluconacetobacter johannae DSM 13595]|uniref:Sigma-54-dependent Fis family transcriptional regulator n=2 Tax=Gluconacetobacter johannae TaxID=112140 RepID=A0A7W4J726_9PROT|nr:sigma-54-dependent Fis family transcriptional regulator [Gluconacetobacter johannae]GBQ82795.1 transcriptional regulator [Gluconacetobacter johannae DSM 13595]
MTVWTKRMTHFHSTFAGPAPVIGEGAGAILDASWRRCGDYALDPSRPGLTDLLTGVELRRSCEEAGPLLRFADPELDRLHGIVGGLEYAVLLADPNGVVLTRRTAMATERGCRRWHLWPGAIWSEQNEGTNGIGTCLAEGRAVTVHMNQHWRVGLRYLACTAVPVHDALGRLAGALDASCIRPDSEGRESALIRMAITDAARRIESRCFMDLYRGHTIVTMGEGEGSSAPMLALDDDRRVVGATHAARLRLGLQPGDALSLCLTDSAQSAGTPGFRNAEKAVIQAALATARGNVTAAAHGLGISRSTLHRKIRALALADADS